MEIDFVKLMRSKSDDGLQEYIDQRQKYHSEAVFAAIEELKKRGRTFTDEEIENIKSDLEINKKRITESESSDFPKWNKNIVKDIDAPEYYSERAIYLSSILFGVLFASILLAINFRKTEKKHGKLSVVLFGIIYSGLQIWALSLIPRNILLTLVTSGGGGIILNNYF